MLGKSAFIIY